MATVTAEKLGLALGVAAEEVRELTRSGVIPKPAKGKDYDFIPALQGYVAHLRDQIGVAEKKADTATSAATAYKPSYCTQARKLCELGATDFDLAEAFQVNRSTIHRWQISKPKFRQALQCGKKAADERVERSLYERAVGYTYDAVKIFLPKDSRIPVYAPYREHVPPSEVACFFWLTNRDKENWQHRHQLEHTGKNGGPIRTITGTMTLVEMAALYARTLADPDAVIESDEVALLERPVNQTGT